MYCCQGGLGVIYLGGLGGADSLRNVAVDVALLII
jgi:hypothetical protein